MKRALAAAVAVGSSLAAFSIANVSATTSTCSSTAASSSRTNVAGCNSSSQYAQLETRLGGDIATALAAEERLSAQLDQYAADGQSLSAEITQEEAAVASLEDQIAQLNQEITTTQQKIDVERQQLAALARAIYRQPDSFWLILARTGNLHDALTATSDYVVAGQHATAIQDQLQADLDSLQSDLQARQDQLDRENGTLDLLVANLSALNEVVAQQTSVSTQLAALVTQIHGAEAGLTGQAVDVTASLAQLLEAQLQDLVLRSYEQAWTMAQVGTGLAMVTHELPTGTSIHGLHLSWPMVKFTITQPFGPTSVLLEPPYGPYAHYHTGIDISAPLGTPVMAAADGVVVAVAHTYVGYGNYVVIAHGGGIATLYGHLLSTNVTPGQLVVRGQQVGREGSTGFSTGPHVHFELRVNNAVVDPMPYLPVPGTSWSG